VSPWHSASNIVIGGLRVEPSTKVAYNSGMTYGIGTTLIRATVKISTGIIIACCLYLCSFFEMILPTALTHMPAHEATSYPTRKVSITVTTRTDVHNSLQLPSVTTFFPVGNQGPWAPIVRLEARSAMNDSHITGCDSNRWDFSRFEHQSSDVQPCILVYLAN
jgi:hypothetical protein